MELFSFYDARDGRTLMVRRCNELTARQIARELSCEYSPSRHALRNLTDPRPLDALQEMLHCITMTPVAYEVGMGHYVL